MTGLVKIELLCLQITIKLNLPEPGEYGIEIYASESKKKRSFAYACQYLILYMAEEEKTPFVEEICRGQSRDDSEAANASYLEAEKEVTHYENTPMQYIEIFKL